MYTFIRSCSEDKRFVEILRKEGPTFLLPFLYCFLCVYFKGKGKNSKLITEVIHDREIFWDGTKHDEFELMSRTHEQYPNVPDWSNMYILFSIYDRCYCCRCDVLFVQSSSARDVRGLLLTYSPRKVDFLTHTHHINSSDVTIAHEVKSSCQENVSRGLNGRLLHSTC